MPSSGCQKCALDRKSTRLNSSHTIISYAVFCLKKKTRFQAGPPARPSHTHSRRSTPRHTRAHCHKCGKSLGGNESGPDQGICLVLFFFIDPAPPEITPLSLPAALPI